MAELGWIAYIARWTLSTRRVINEGMVAMRKQGWWFNLELDGTLNYGMSNSKSIFAL